MNMYKITVSTDGATPEEYDVRAPTLRAAFANLMSDQEPKQKSPISVDVPTPTVPCPSCGGAGELQESFFLKAYSARVMDCPDCQGSGYVSHALKAQLKRRGPLTMPKNWVPS